MSNTSPATVTVTSTTGPGNTVTALRMTDVTNIQVDLLAQTLRIQRQGAQAISYFDYSALGTVTWTISGGITTVAFS